MSTRALPDVPVDPQGMTAHGRRTILHVLGTLNRGGAERRTLEVISALSDDSVRFIICTLTGRPGSMAADYRRAGAHVIPLRLRDPLFPFRFIRLVRRERVDVVHSHVHYSSAVILGLAWLGRIPGRIAHFRSDSDGSKHTRARRLRNHLFKFLLRRTATAVVGVAPGSLEANWGEDWRRDSRFEVIPNGIDLASFAPSSALNLRHDLGVQAEDKLIIHLGRADIATKNRELAVQIVGELRRLQLGWHLIFVGRDGSSDGDASVRREALRALAQREEVGDRVHFLGEREDVPSLLSAVDLLLLTSTREGLPGVLLEAAACGIPAVSSDVPGAIYISETVHSVTIVPLGTSLAGWALAIQKRCAEGSADAAVSANLVGGPFDLAVSLERYRSLWKLI